MTVLWEEWASVSVSYLCEVQQHPCGWISDNRETRVKWRRSAVEEWVDVNFSLSHPGEENSYIFRYMWLFKEETNWMMDQSVISDL